MALNTVAKNFIPEIFDADIMRTKEDNLILPKISKAVPTKVGSGFADTVYYGSLAEPTMGSSTASLSAEDLKDELLMFKIDTEVTYCYKVADLDAIMSPADLKSSQAARAGYRMSRQVETTILQNAGSSAAAGTALAANITTLNAYIQTGLLAQMLAENNVDMQDMWMIIPPWLQLKLQLSGVKFSINNGVNGTGKLAWTNDLGFDVYVTNTVYNSGTQALPVSSILAGSYQAIGYQDILLPVRTNQLTNARSTQIDGGLVYGWKVLKPKELALGTFTYVAETNLAAVS